jgi:hypothetical protein
MNRYVLIHEYVHGTSARVFQYVPTDDLPHPNIEKVVRALDIAFEPWEGETIKLISFDGDIEVLTAEQVGARHIYDDELNEDNPGGFEDPDTNADEDEDEDEE